MRAHGWTGVILIALGAMTFGTTSANALTAELAKKCVALTTKAFPPRDPVNPAAGSAKGTGRQQSAYYQTCVANNGTVPDATAASATTSEPASAPAK